MFRFLDFFSKVVPDPEKSSDYAASDSEVASDSEAPVTDSDDFYLATYSDTHIDSHIFGYLMSCNAASQVRIDLPKDAYFYVFGSSANECNFVLQESGIENRHCRLEWTGNKRAESGVYVDDLSSNGTYINDVTIDKTAELYSGDELRIGSATFRYHHTADLNQPKGMHARGVHAEYSIGGVFATGSNAILYTATNRTSRKHWAVKRVTKAKTKKRLTYEVHTMEKVGSHLNVCFLRDVFYQYDGSINLVLEYVEGGDLQKYLNKHKHRRMPDYDAKRITYEICCAMTHVHSKGIIHRDLKLANILLTLDKPPVVKVADFGFAIVADKLLVSKNLVGTKHYMAPELIDSTGYYTNKIDSWSVGIMVWMMLTGSEHVKENDLATMKQSRRWLSTFEVGLNDPLGAFNIELQAKCFILALLERDPLARASLTQSRFLSWLLDLTASDGAQEQAEMKEVCGMLLRN